VYNNDVECEMWDGGSGMGNGGCGMWDVGCGMGDVGYRMSDVGCGMWDVGCGMWDVGCGMWDVGCGMSYPQSSFPLPSSLETSNPGKFYPAISDFRLNCACLAI